MKVNIGTADRVIRVIVGVVIVGLGFHYRSWWGLVGLLPLLTAAVRRCPAYVPFGISTCRCEAEKPPAAPAP
jgi:hypothetical protein